jgi:predicted enzyme related to lactoylglutathione lyase
MILDFMTGDADVEYPRIEALGVGWVLRPATQPWGSRSMVFKDPAGNLVNVFSRP